MRLKELRLAHDVSQKVIAEVLDCSTVVYNRYENGTRTPSMETLQRLANYYNVTVDYLIGNSNCIRTSDAVRIPVVGSVQAGIPTEAIEDVLDWEEISAKTASQGDYIGLKVKGSSMEPRFIDGDTVIVRRQPDVESGEVAIVFVNGDEATMKKVIKKSDGITLVALNVAVYEPHFYSFKEIETLPVTIFGKVVELRGKL